MPKLHKILCPMCKYETPLFITEKFINFDLRIATDKVRCGNCKRMIRYSVEERKEEIE